MRPAVSLVVARVWPQMLAPVPSAVAENSASAAGTPVTSAACCVPVVAAVTVNLTCRPVTSVAVAMPTTISSSAPACLPTNRTSPLASAPGTRIAPYALTSDPSVAPSVLVTLLTVPSVDVADLI